MDDLENNLKVSNWLGILTYDAFKYAAAGGSLEVVPTEKGLTLVLVGITPAEAGLNKKFRALLPAVTEEVQE